MAAVYRKLHDDKDETNDSEFGLQIRFVLHKKSLKIRSILPSNYMHKL